MGERVFPITPEDLAILFHDTYEALAPSFGYETRTETRQFDKNSANGKLMIAVCKKIIAKLVADSIGAKIQTLKVSEGDIVVVQVPDEYTDFEFKMIVEEFKRNNNVKGVEWIIVRGLPLTLKSVDWLCPEHYSEMCAAYMGEVQVLANRSEKAKKCAICGKESNNCLAVDKSNLKEVLF